MPAWPDGDGKRIYAYLKRFAALPAVLSALARRANPTLVYVDGVEKAIRRKFESSTLRFEDRPLDLNRVGAECATAVINPGHRTTSAMLLAGKPVLQLPLFAEQRLMAAAVCRLGAGEVASAKAASADEIEQKLDALLTTDRYTGAAPAFASRHSDFDPQARRELMLRRTLELLA